MFKAFLAPVHPVHPCFLDVFLLTRWSAVMISPHFLSSRLNDPLKWAFSFILGHNASLAVRIEGSVREEVLRGSSLRNEITFGSPPRARLGGRLRWWRRCGWHHFGFGPGVNMCVTALVDAASGRVVTARAAGLWPTALFIGFEERRRLCILAQVGDGDSSSSTSESAGLAGHEGTRIQRLAF